MDRRGSESFTEQSSYLLQNSNFGNDVLAKINAFRGEAFFTDVILCIDNEEFPCHRNVLAVSSSYFHTMFTTGLRERKEGKICFNEVSPWTLKRIIDYAYTGKIEITSDNAQEMLAAGTLFHYPAIVEACCEFLKCQLHSSNCLGIENFAQLHSCENLQEKANKFALENFSTIFEFDEFLELPLERILSYISSDLIDVRNEETVCDAVFRWINYDKDERHCHLCTILEQVRLPVVDIYYLKSMEQESLIRRNENCLHLVQEALKHHESIIDQHGKRRRSMQTHKVQPRPSTVAKEVIVVVGGLNNFISKTVEMYDPPKDKWSYLPDFPKLVSWYSVGAISNSIIVSGGILEGHIVTTVWKFDVVKRLWTEVCPMLTARARHTCAVLNDYLYVFGGMMSQNGKLVDVESIECYDPVLDSWKNAGTSMFPRKQSHAVPYQDMLVEVGGLQGEAKVNTIDSFMVWSTYNIRSTGEQFILPEPIQYCQFVVLNGIFYIIWEDSKKVITLDPKKRKFRRLPDLNYAHVDSGATVLGGKIYLTGGLIDSRPTKVMEVYDPATDQWTIEKSMSQARACHGCVTVQM